ncbi:MAG: DUF6517 family protein, partial [Halobacteriota archaeon]
FEATAASVAEATLDQTGYEEHAVEEVTAERTFEAADQSQDVIVTNWQSEYDKRVSLGDIGGDVRAAIFTVLATPRVRVLDREFNPVADMSAAELAEMVQDRYDGMSDLEQVDSTEASVLGESTTVGEFEGRAQLVEPGQDVDIVLQIAEAVTSGDDLVVCIGAYPQVLRTQETDNYFTLLGGVEHDG